MLVIAAIVIAILGFLGYQYWKYKATDNGAPYVPLEPDVVEAVLHLADVKEDDVVYDLGSGDGRVAIMAALQRGAKAVGIEIDYLRYLYSKYQIFLLRLGDKVSFLHKDIFKENISQASVVIMYLLEETNEALIKKLLEELKPGTRIVTAAFQIPDWVPVDMDDVHVTPFGPLYLYEVGTSNP